MQTFGKVAELKMGSSFSVIVHLGLIELVQEKWIGLITIEYRHYIVSNSTGRVDAVFVLKFGDQGWGIVGNSSGNETLIVHVKSYLRAFVIHGCVFIEPAHIYVQVYTGLVLKLIVSFCI